MHPFLKRVILLSMSMFFFVTIQQWANLPKMENYTKMVGWAIYCPSCTIMKAKLQ